jgi:hypothetical protein
MDVEFDTFLNANAASTVGAILLALIESGVDVTDAAANDKTATAASKAPK